MENRSQIQNDEMEINLVEVALVLARKISLMIAVGLCTAMLAFLYSKFIVTPTYQSTTKIYVLNKQDNVNLTSSDLQMGLQLTKDYPELIKSRFVLESVINELDLPFTYESLNGMVSVAAPTDTRVIAITVTDSDPVRAMDIANQIREAAAVHIGNVMETEAVNVVETANLPTYKASPSVGKNTVMGGMVGVLIVAAVTIILYLTNDTVKTAEDVERYLGLSTLAVIPMNEGSSKKRRKKNGRKR